MILEGNKINLRPLKESDFESFLKWHSDKDIRFLTTMHPFLVTEKSEKTWFESILNDTSNKKILYVVEDKEKKRPIGYFQLVDINYINRNASLGIVIGEKEFQGKGLGIEIMELGINYGFKYLSLNKISLLVLSENIPAIKLYNKLNFVLEGEFKDEYLFNGKYFDIKRFAIFNPNENSFL
jgi:RimJ/RimL family protein N-acetyltransferase